MIDSEFNRAVKKHNRDKYEAYLKSAEWFAKREDAFRYHGRFCSKCKATKNLHVHHITYKAYSTSFWMT